MTKTSAASARSSADKRSRTSSRGAAGATADPVVPDMLGPPMGSDMEKVDRHIITREEYEEIPELHEDWLRPVEIDEATGRIVNRGGRPRKPDAKVQVSLRLRPATLRHFKSLGQGWQQRIEDILNAVVSFEQDAAERAEAEAKRKEEAKPAEVEAVRRAEHVAVETTRPASDAPRPARRRRSA